MQGFGKWAAFMTFMLAVAAAQAQPPGRRNKPATARSAEAPKAAPAAAKPAPSDEPAAPAAETSSATPPPESPPPPAADDLGARPPPLTAERSAGVSPLNPAAKEFPGAAIETAPVNYDVLLADVAALRARVAALTATLFRSRLRVTLATDGSDARVARVSVTLDDGVVFSGGDRFVADDGKVVYEHAVAPGNHVVGVEIERYDVREGSFRTWQTSRFSVVVPENKLLETRVLLEDDSDMADDFPDDEAGEYDLRVRLEAWVDS